MLVANIKYVFLTSQLIYCQTKLQSLDTRNMKLKDPDLGDLADNPNVTDPFLGTGQGQKKTPTVINQCKHSSQFEIFYKSCIQVNKRSP